MADKEPRQRPEVRQTRHQQHTTPYIHRRLLRQQQIPLLTDRIRHRDDRRNKESQHYPLELNQVQESYPKCISIRTLRHSLWLRYRSRDQVYSR
jgi:hypothetical protein